MIKISANDIIREILIYYSNYRSQLATAYRPSEGSIARR